MCYRAAQLQEDQMLTQIVMDATGDTRHHFDPTDPAAVAQAERRFLELKQAGSIAAKPSVPMIVRHRSPESLAPLRLRA
jgi:hypothetical protein